MSTRVFVDGACSPGALVTIPAQDARHLAVVLRAERGDAIVVVADGRAWQARLETLDKDAMTARVVEAVHERREFPVPLAVLQALPKGNKMDDVVEKVTELGATRIVPVRCAQSYGSDAPAKIKRWRRIARAAAAQSKRSIVPQVDDAMDLTLALTAFAKDAHVLVAWERAPLGSLASSLERADVDRALAIVVGPEGSFSHEELEEIRRLRCDLVSLGPTTLRTETAAAAAIAAVAALRSWW